MGSLNSDVRVDPPGSKRLDMGPISRRYLVNAVVGQSGPRAKYTCPSPPPRRVGFWERMDDLVRF